MNKNYSEEQLESFEEMTVENLISKEADLIQRIKQGLVDKSQLLEKAEIKLKEFAPHISDEDFKIIIDSIELKALKLGKITPLIEREDISDIKFLSNENIRIKRRLTKEEEKIRGKKMDREPSGITFKNQMEYERFIRQVATKNKSSLANANAEQIITDRNTSDNFILRIAIGTKFISSVEQHYMHIRKIPKFKRSLYDLSLDGFMSREEMNYLANGMKKGLSFIICAKGSAGKTSLFNALLEEFPHNKAGLIIQETPELFSQNHPEMMFLNVTNNDNDENSINYTLKEHSVWGLKVDTDLFGIGEITGDEAYYFANACYTGYQTLATIHSFNARGALTKLNHYAERDIMPMLEDIDGCIYVENFEIKEIVEVEGYDSASRTIIYNDLFKDHKRVNESCEKVQRKLNREG